MAATGDSSHDVMERLLISGSRIIVTRLGLGCARLLGGRETNSSAKLIETALRAGIRHFDTAPAHGSEDVLGEVLAGSSEASITTKVGFAGRPAVAASRRQLGRDEVPRDLSESLRRLKRASVDLYLPHEPDGVELTDEIRELFTSPQAQGKLRACEVVFSASSRSQIATIAQCAP